MVGLESIKAVGRVIRKIVRITTYTVGTIGLIGGLTLWIYSTYFMLPQNPLEVAKQHELRSETDELQHRIEVCNSQIDNMIVGATNGAALHCALMWSQLKKLQTFVGQMHITDPDLQPLVDTTRRAANRYMEYQSAIDYPRYKPSEDSESTPKSESLQPSQSGDQPAQIAQSSQH